MFCFIQMQIFYIDFFDALLLLCYLSDKGKLLFSGYYNFSYLYAVDILGGYIKISIRYIT